MGVFGRRRPRELTLIWLFLLPALLVFLIYRILPIFWLLVLSFQEWSLFGGVSWAGLLHYEDMYYDEVFWESLANTVIFLLGSAAAIPLAVGIALLVNAPIRFAGVYRSIIFLSYPMMTVAIGIVWRWLYDEQVGLINAVLVGLGLIDERIPFLESFDWALPAVIIAWGWHIIGLFMVIVLAGLQTIPHELYDAAAIDGASRTRAFFAITLPLLRPTIFLCLIMAILNSFISFDLIYIMTDGGPGHATELLVTYIYKAAFELNRLDYGAALTVVLFVLLLVVTFVANLAAGGDAGGERYYE